MVTDAHFANLQELRFYARAYPELVKNENTDVLDPRYKLFYETLQPRLWKKALRFLGLHTTPEWDAAAFKDLITKVVDRRRRQPLHKENVRTLLVSQGAKCIFFGDLFGAFHSLDRDLHELQRQGVIDEHLTIVAKDTYIIFLGNVINRSPYSLETLTTVLTLMDKNPERVMYLKGTAEKDENWENFTMRTALRLRATDACADNDGDTPLRSLINSFFNTLPSILKIQHQGNEKELLYGVHKNLDDELLLHAYTYAVVYGEHEMYNFSHAGGLDFLGFMYGTTQWGIFSAPVQIYQEFFKFYFDAFVTLEMGDTLPKSMLTLHKHDVRKQETVFVTQSYDLIFGNTVQSMADFKLPIFNNEPFDFGSTLDLTGAVQGLGNDIKRGIDSAVYEKNFKQGIQQRFIRPNIFDDAYTPRRAKKNIEILTKQYDIPLICLPVGSPTLAAYLDMVQKGTVSVLFPVTGDPLFRKPELKHIINLRASYADEAKALIDYAIKEYGVKSFAFFYQDDNYGRGPLETAHRVLKTYGIDSWLDIPYARTQTDFVEAAEKLKKASSEAVLFFSTGIPTQELLRQLGTGFAMGKHFFGISFLEGADLKRYLADRGIKFIFSSVVPNPLSDDLEIVRNYRAAMDTYGFRYDNNSLESWIGMQLLFDAYEHAKEPLKRESLLAYLESLKNYPLGGIIFTFHPEIRSFKLPVWLENEDGKRVKVEV